MGTISGSAKEKPFRFGRGRKGRVSITDCLLLTLGRQKDGRWPKYSFSELAERVSSLRRAPVSSPSIRSVVYRRPSLFERADGDEEALVWKLSVEGRGIWAKKDSI
jgi:hypothetical protein